MNNIPKIVYRKDTVSESILLDFLNHFSQEPKIPLSKRVNIDAYAQKLKQSGSSFEAWVQDDLIGVLFAYINDHINKKAFISYFRVRPEYRGCGIGKKLLNDCFIACQQAHFDSVDLEVDIENTKALNLYERIGFANKIKKDNTFILSKSFR